jgi:hypothetical protein
MARIGLQMEYRERNMALLRAFADKYTDAHPVGMSSIDASVSFDSSKVDYCRKTFGPEGWVTESTYQITKTVDQVRVTLEVPRGFQKQEVTL